MNSDTRARKKWDLQTHM